MWITQYNYAVQLRSLGHSMFPDEIIIIIIIIIHSFYIALFSALKQTHCAHVACDSEWVTILLQRVLLISTEVVYW